MTKAVISERGRALAALLGTQRGIYAKPTDQGTSMKHVSALLDPAVQAVRSTFS